MESVRLCAGAVEQVAVDGQVSGGDAGGYAGGLDSGMAGMDG